ncbi:MAG: hypothetical protein EXR55_07135 [Dehalococcoidia bacterium]|nr:hypothetical protein [Dehalococcoidia bacterium]
MKCKIAVAASLIRHECVAVFGRYESSGDDGDYRDALRFYQSINDQQSSGALMLVLKGRRRKVYVKGNEQRLAARYRL